MTLDGSVERAEDGGWIVVFDRLMDKPPEKVWSVLTEPRSEERRVRERVLVAV